MTRQTIIFMLASLLVGKTQTKGHLPGIATVELTTTEQFIGPEKGYLVIAGGGIDKPLLEKFISLLGDKQAKIVIITTADEDEMQNKNFYNNVKRRFTDAGAKNIEVLHTRDTAVANSDKFLEPIKEAKGVWFTGGRQWRLVDAYFNTKVLKELNSLLDRGGVIGGNSAGATVQGSFLARGDSKSNLIIDGDHKEGFGFLKNSAIDQHLLIRNRQFDMFELRKKYPDLLGIGIDEKTAIIVHQNELEVIGEKYVAIYDGKFLLDNGSTINLPSNSERFYFLSAGNKYDLMKRQVKNATEK
jgi:cyanophycinase